MTSDFHQPPNLNTEGLNAEGQARTVSVWDFPTRIFHWSFAVMVFIAYVSSEADGGAFWIHVYSGTALIGFVAFRIVWGVIGSRYAQFGDFVQGPATVSEYSKRLMAFRPPYSVGHNPLGGWMVMALLVIVLLASLTGLMTREDDYIGPLSHIAGGLFGEAHEGFGSFVMVLVGVHVLGVVAHGLISRENLVRSMITGLKSVPAGVKAASIGSVGVVRPAIALVIALVVVLYFMQL